MAVDEAEAEKRGLEGLKVVSLESRRAVEMEKLIRSYGGDPVVAPSMREIPLEENPQAFDFFERLQAGHVDLVIFMTGVGVRTLAEVLESRFSPDEIAGALAGVTTLARGPKPVRALRDLGVTPALTVPEPNTWREVLAVLDSDPGAPSLEGSRVVVQEYGISNEELLHELERRGARAEALPIYRWALPEERGPLERAIELLARGGADILLMLNATQATHMLQVAAQMGLEQSLREALAGMLVGSIGPTCTEVMRRHDLPVDFEPEHPRMGHLVREAAMRSLASRGATAPAARPRPAPEEPLPAVWNDAPFLRACRREPTPYTPVWLMRQAGRYMKEYREVRARNSFLELCKNPELVAEVTTYAAERLGVDAAIIFADILLIVEPLGLNLEYSAGEGPVISPPVRNGADVDRLSEVDPTRLDYVYQAVSATRRALDPRIPLIGFCGAPFTVVSYLIEGGGSRSYEETKLFMYRDEGAWNALMERVVRGLIGYVDGQVQAGAQVIQLFDSWVGCLSPRDYRRYVQPHSAALIRGIRPGVPVIHFGTGATTLLPAMREAGGDVIGLDWRVELRDGWAQIGHDRAVQGNMDPLLLFAEPERIREEAAEILEQAGNRPGHIFNLGHGILPRTPVDNVVRLVEWVHELSAR